MPFGCFVAGTPVLSAEGERPIEALRVGERVLTPQSKDDDGTAVVPETWRKVGLEVAHEDGSKVELELLRPVTWIEEHDCKTGSRIWLEMDELGVKGWATTRSVEACPQIASGMGRVILATMQRVHPQVVRLDLADDSELEATANHPLYSLTRNDWTAAGELEEGEILATADGSTTVRTVSSLPGEHRVFNLEVESDHCYFTGHARVLSHNTCAAANSAGPLRFSQTTASPFFSAEGSMGGRAISSVADDLRAGVLKPADLPVEYLVRDGNSLLINTRSSLALKQANIPESSWSLINRTGVESAEAAMTERLLRNGLGSGGTDVLRITGAGKGASVLRP